MELNLFIRDLLRPVLAKGILCIYKTLPSVKPINY
jgi:hypothetical protein